MKIDNDTRDDEMHSNVCMNCGEGVGPLVFEWASGGTGETRFCPGCGEPVAEVLDHGLLEAEPGEEADVVRHYDGRHETATADDDGVLRDDRGRSYSSGAYSRVETDGGETMPDDPTASMSEAEEEIFEATQAVGIVDEPGVVNLFAFPPDADPDAVADLANRLSHYFDEAETAFMTGRVDGDVGVDSMQEDELNALALARVREVQSK